MWIWVSVAILGVIMALLGVFLWRLNKKGWKHETDYRAFFYMGLVWFPLGLALDMPFFFILGLVYMGVGLANRDKWNKKTKTSPEAKKWLLISVFAGLVALVLGTLVFLLLA